MDVNIIDKNLYKMKMWVVKLLNVKSMYVISLSCVRVNGGESECFRIDSDVKRMARGENCSK